MGYDMNYMMPHYEHMPMNPWMGMPPMVDSSQQIMMNQGFGGIPPMMPQEPQEPNFHQMMPENQLQP
eukprot:CAMPEP_0170556318 /NCGR_PEP_ID=MMETSP0211-20121228/16238_1 /TAXON_ID=311385 /ORGANISM="Pseudokeronopsis sp., Strain OXSARD2" /LENGTH=66 /DNA_ID=CAMNT_0010866579 /DNA_START=512 /DNA_END=712 /DNA_ORIENTATION=+